MNQERVPTHDPLASAADRKGESSNLAELILESKFEEIQALEILVMHLLEEFSSIQFIQQNAQPIASQPAFSTLQAPDPPRISTPYVAKRSFKGSIAQLELLISLKQACISRIKDKDQIEQFKKEIKEINGKIINLKGMK